MEKVTLDIVKPMSKEQSDRLEVLLSDEGSLSEEESKERTALIFMKIANMRKTLAVDKFLNKTNNSHADRAISNWLAYLRYSNEL